MMNDLAITLGATYIPYYEKSIIALIEEQAAHKTAVYDQNRAYSYRELISKANALAQRLKESTEPQQLIPIFMRGGIKYLVSLLASLKLNAVFVPLDPGWPEERIKRLLDHLEFKFLLTDQTAIAGYPAILVDETLEAAAPLTRLCRPDDLIYGLYTSGSTGEPKCALNYHKGVLNRLLFMNRRFGMGEGDVVLQNSSIAFDSSLWQLFWPLINGQAVVLPASGGYNLLERLDLIEKYLVTYTDFVPTIFNGLVNYLQSNQADLVKLNSLKALLIGGEEISLKDVKRFKEFFPQVDLVNTYGHTENSIGSVFHSIQDLEGKIPLGTPIDNTFALILDNDKIAPLNTLGEIAVGGECLGAGYYKNEQQTARVYVELDGGQKVYKTGDFGYVGDDHLLYFAGREDQQFKINGIRVDTQEMIDTICQFEGVENACLLLGGEGGKKYLICPLVLKDAFDQTKLQEMLAAKFPAAILPKEYPVFSHFPTNSSGKLDKKALWEQINQRTKAKNGDALHAIWEQLLNTHVHEESDFFKTGGDSLDAIRLVCLINDTYHLSVKVSDLYTHSTLAAQRKLIQQGGLSAKSSTALMEEDQKLVLPSYPRKERTGSAILLFGANGFIGIHTLAELLKDPEKEVYCLIRGGPEKLWNAAQKYQVEIPGRVKIIPGDLTKPEDYEWLAERIGTVYNCAGAVNFTAGYEFHREVNVTALKNMLRFCCKAQAHLHHISSASVDLSEGYQASKYVGEQLCQRAKEQGVHVTIYRVGEAMPHSKHPIPHEKSLAHTLHAFLIEEQLILGDIEWYDYTPVDRIAAAIVSHQNREIHQGISCSALFAHLKNEGWKLASSTEIIQRIKTHPIYEVVHSIAFSRRTSPEEAFKEALSLKKPKAERDNIEVYLDFIAAMKSIDKNIQVQHYPSNSVNLEEINIWQPI